MDDLSLSPPPALLPSFTQFGGAGLGWGRGDKVDKKKKKENKAACSNRLLPMGCHGNSGTGVTPRPLWVGFGRGGDKVGGVLS